MKKILKINLPKALQIWEIYSAVILSITLFGCASTSLQMSKGVKVTTSFEVGGNCDMCKKRIENALDKKGINKVYYDLENHRLFCEYNSAAFSEIQIHNIIAAVGHDTEKVEADRLIYENLPGCCKYRKEEKW
jgi:mercuric ion binding protein